MMGRSLFDNNHKVNINTPISAKREVVRRTEDDDDTIQICLNCSEETCSGKCAKLKCIHCEHRKYFGDLSIVYCSLTNKEIHRKTVCPKEKI